MEPEPAADPELGFDPADLWKVPNRWVMLAVLVVVLAVAVVIGIGFGSG